jgi:hypothetical protein
MTDASAKPIILRNKDLFILACIGFPGTLSIGAFVDIYLAPVATIADSIQYTAVNCILSWCLWLIGINSRLIIRNTSLDVINWMTEYFIPYPNIESMNLKGGVTIKLTNGWLVRPSVGGGSLVSALRGNKLQKGIRERIEARRSGATEGDEPSAPQRKFNVHPVMFLLMTAIFETFAIVCHFVLT